MVWVYVEREQFVRMKETKYSRQLDLHRSR